MSSALLNSPGSNIPANAFFFDGNLWFGIVDSQERLAELETYYPTKKYLQARLYAEGGIAAYPCFGFKGEGISLEAFLNASNVHTH
ncbi:hypothetical protein BWI93_25545 [Siphonobacter sp. BAB-5385]|uniref:hypothetical protein n=1 Tax=unclassified Siphonobacter TaxID=2635712 RepID=UPI000B9DFAFE|nr:MULTISPECIES: hypothetical protein [unclassified Siphonobacter]OZI05457.1 hypothetical protein BWI93_25545 [Siphonobacter sp. BAB-5385]PMD99434.1 hypothetical protein BWI97_00305 [Siphonobacter sp. BAB-5405]